MKYLLLFTLLVSCHPETDCPIGKTIKSVGGCNRHGNCGVLYTDGTKGYMYFPVVGQVCK